MRTFFLGASFGALIWSLAMATDNYSRWLVLALMFSNLATHTKSR